MHLLREGQFSVAATFLDEIAQAKSPAQPEYDENPISENNASTVLDQIHSERIREEFTKMYHILHELRENSNLLPAIDWARDNRSVLGVRGSNLEFELCRLQFVWLFNGGTEPQYAPSSRGRQAALQYARQEFSAFTPRYLKEIQQLIGAMAFWPNLDESPYRHIFNNPTAWSDVAHSFTREFCSLLGLSADSPLYIAATAGAIALPTLLKLQTIMKAKRTEWTTQDELPVRITFYLDSLSYAAVLTEISTGRDTATALVSIPFDIRVPRLKRTNYRSEPAYDDAMRSRHCAGVTSTNQQGEQVQMPLLPEREPCKERSESYILMEIYITKTTMEGVKGVFGY